MMIKTLFKMDSIPMLAHYAHGHEKYRTFSSCKAKQIKFLLWIYFNFVSQSFCMTIRLHICCEIMLT